MQSKNLLIIFYRNPELGKVKTRLAKTLGDENALAIYLHLSSHTRAITENLMVDKVIYYSDFVDTEDAWANSTFQKKIQTGSDLGEKMRSAFATEFNNGYEKIIIIGTDCLELDEKIIQQGFDSLQKYDSVIGPAKDGGYYLLGIRKLIPELFINKKWSSDTVASDTTNDLTRLGYSYTQLPRLSDVDEERDLPHGFL
jgi:uncharacterized protein